MPLCYSECFKKKKLKKLLNSCTLKVGVSICTVTLESTLSTNLHRVT